MRKSYDFEVTEVDIESARVNGAEGDSFKCMVAEAVKRQVPDAHHVEVDVQTVRWSDKEGRHVFLTPYEVAGYVIAFDNGDEMHPFDFRLRNPAPTLQKQHKKSAAKHAKQSRSKLDRERARKQKAEATLGDPEAPAERKAAAAERVAEAPQRIADAEAEHESVKAAYRATGESMSAERISESTRKIPRNSKLRKREYGLRVLRVNQGEGRTQVH